MTERLILFHTFDTFFTIVITCQISFIESHQISSNILVGAMLNFKSANYHFLCRCLQIFDTNVAREKGQNVKVRRIIRLCTNVFCLSWVIQIIRDTQGWWWWEGGQQSVT